ncbi:MAG: SprT family zinc-dependent metalloprotease [Verrucomicrobiota bacterium]
MLSVSLMSWKAAMAEFKTSAGQLVPVEIRRRKGTRHLRLSLGPANQIIASLPWHCPDRECARFIEKNRSWLEVQLRQTPAPMNLFEWFAKSPYLSASGDCFTVFINETGEKRLCYSFEKEGADVHLHLPLVGRDIAILKLVRNFAKDVLNARVAYQARRLGLKYSKLTVRDQSSRWGSCTSSRAISLNWRLVLLEPTLQDYVILHELAHLKEMNHSPRFWKLLEAYDPQRSSHEKELDVVTPQLMRVGRS